MIKRFSVHDISDGMTNNADLINEGIVKEPDALPLPYKIGYKRPPSRKGCKVQLVSMNYSTIKDKLMGITDNRNRALLCLLFATGGRIGEIVSGNRERVKKRSKRKRRMKRVEMRKKGLISITKFQGLMPNAVTANKTSDGKQFVQILIHTEKNPRQPTRFVYVPRSKEEWLFMEILKWIDKKPMDLPLFPRKSSTKRGRVSIGKRRVEGICKKELGFHPHNLRHLRTSALLSGEAWGEPMHPQIVQQLLGWANLQSMEKYSHMNALSVAQKFW